MSNLLSELEAVVALDQRATPGTVELHTSCSWRRIIAGRGQPFLVPTIDPDRHQNMDTIENAQFVVALVNWFRTHHAEIAAAVRKAARYDWLVQTIPGQICMEALNRPPTPDDDMDEAIDQRIAAMSAREGQG